MSNVRLIRRNGQIIPGGSPYQDPRVPTKHFDGMECGDFDGQIRLIIQFRAANPNIYPPSEPQYLNYDFVADQLDAYQCARLGNNPMFCQGAGIGNSYSSIAATGKCSCGGELEKRYCPTCGQGNTKLVGYTCKGCGKNYDR